MSFWQRYNNYYPTNYRWNDNDQPLYSIILYQRALGKQKFIGFEHRSGC